MTSNDDSDPGLLEALEGLTIEEPHGHRLPETRLGAAEAVESFQALSESEGFAALATRFAGLERPEIWMRTAYCSVTEQGGTAGFLRLAGEPGAQVGDGLVYFGRVAPPGSSRLICEFSAPSRGLYALSARIGNWAGTIPADVEALIDGRSLGQVQLTTGTLDRTFTARLGQGNHEFEVREDASGAPAFFVGLTVWAVPVVLGGS